MANQSPDRRRVLELLAKVSLASQFPGFSRWIFASEQDHAQPRPPAYQPQFFNASEYRTIEVLTDLIIPADESPGAAAAGVSEFIDFMAAHGEPDLQNIRQELQKFVTLSPANQAKLLTSISQKGASGHAFFLLIRKYTVMGYYTSRIGLEELNYPGLHFYSQSPECPHKNDPEHLHLTAAKG